MWMTCRLSWHRLKENTKLLWKTLRWSQTRSMNAGAPQPLAHGREGWEQKVTRSPEMTWPASKWSLMEYPVSVDISLNVPHMSWKHVFQHFKLRDKWINTFKITQSFKINKAFKITPRRKIPLRNDCVGDYRISFQKHCHWCGNEIKLEVEVCIALHLLV